MNLTRRTFLQTLGFSIAQAGVFSYFPSIALPAVSDGRFPVSTPEKQGLSSSGILRFIKAVEADDLNLHSVMILRHGHVVAEGWWAPYAPELKHTLYSLSKSFTSTAIGMAVEEGRLKVSDKVLSFFPESRPAKVNKNLSEMTVKHLLTMSTGHATDPTNAVRINGGDNWVKAFLNTPPELKPGSRFVYNSAATYMLSAILQKLTGQTLLNYLEQWLFKPLGIEGADWETDPAGICTGGWGLRLKTEDIAKFGQLYLQKGMWNGKKLLSETWINDATGFEIQSVGGSRPKETNDWLQGYGYQFWRCRHNAYRGDGAFGQYCIVVPEKDMVVAITSETSNMQGIMDHVWEHILGNAAADHLPPDTAGVKELQQKLKNLALRIPVAEKTSPVIQKINGKVFRMDDNALGISEIAFSIGGNVLKATLTNKEGKHDLQCGNGYWENSYSDLSILPLKLAPTPVPGETRTRLSGSATWLASDTLEMTLRYTETAHYEKIRFTFSENAVHVTFRKSIAIINGTPDDRPELTGKMS